MFTRFFIERPRFTVVLSLIVIIAGIFAIRVLPLKEYPNLAPVQILVQAYYPGADAETVLKKVATPLESAINGAPGMLYMISSASSSGELYIQVFFRIGTDPEKAKIEVNNRVNKALSQLPDVVKRLGVVVRERSPDFLSVIFFVSKGGVRSTSALSTYVDVHVIDELKRIPGIGDVINWLQKRYSIRVWLYPDKLAKYGLTPFQVYKAIMEQNRQFFGGAFSAEPTQAKNQFTFTVLGEPSLKYVEQFKNIILKANQNGGILRLKDVAKVELGGERYVTVSYYKNMPGVPVGVFLAPGANAITVHNLLMKKLKRLSRSFPSDINYYEVFNTTKFVKESIKEVVFTLIFSVILVMVVIYLFLGKIRVSLIPFFAIPVSVIGAFAGFYLFNFSINLLTLFGLVLAIGLVVDDAIVVIENTERIIEEKGLPPKEAVIESMKEITSPIIAIVLVLSSVFVPSAFSGGFAGRFYMQFALTITIAMVLSGFVALTLTPMLCAYLIEKKKTRKWFLLRLFDKFIDWSRNLYVKGSRLFIKTFFITIPIFIILSIAGFYFISKIPGGLVPYEDKGILLYGGKLYPGASLKETQKVLISFSEILKNKTYVENWGNIGGIDLTTQLARTDSFLGFINLKDWGKRPSLLKILPDLFKEAQKMDEANLFVAPVPPISGMGMVGGFECFVQDTSGIGFLALSQYVEKFIKELKKQPEFMFIQAGEEFNVPAYKIEVDREKAKAYGVNIDTLFNVIAMNFGQFYVNDFTIYGRNFHVNMEGEDKFRRGPEALSNLFVPSKRGTLIPVKSLVKVKRIVYSPILQKFNMFPAIKVSGVGAPGYTSDQVLSKVEEIAKKVFPPGIHLSFAGMSYFEKTGKGNFVYVFGITLVFVYLLLVALYESVFLPVVILFTVPVGIFGASAVFYLITNVLGIPLERDIFFNLGILTIVGLVAKNAILLVEFAEMERKKGKNVLESALYGARVRFRPIVMTSFAFIAGALPLLFSMGAGAISRIIVGLTVISGMLFATLVGIYFIPLFYWLITSGIEKINLSKRNQES